MVAKIVIKKEETGVRFLNNSNPTSFEKLESGKIRATWITGDVSTEE